MAPAATPAPLAAQAVQLGRETGNLLGAVLAVWSWKTPLQMLGRYWPQVVLRLVDELSGNERSRDTH